MDDQRIDRIWRIKLQPQGQARFTCRQRRAHQRRDVHRDRTVSGHSAQLPRGGRRGRGGPVRGRNRSVTFEIKRLHLQRAVEQAGIGQFLRAGGRAVAEPNLNVTGGVNRGERHRGSVGRQIQFSGASNFINAQEPGSSIVTHEHGRRPRPVTLPQLLAPGSWIHVKEERRAANR